MTASAPGPFGITILGSTGSIGASTLDVVARHPQRFRVVALTANASVERLAEQCVRYRPDFAVMVDLAAAAQLARRLQHTAPETEVLYGTDSPARVAALERSDRRGERAHHACRSWSGAGCRGDRRDRGEVG